MQRSYAISLQVWAVYCICGNHKWLVQRFNTESDATGYMAIVQRKVPHNHYQVMYDSTNTQPGILLPN